jgi:hypothetical protein
MSQYDADYFLHGKEKGISLYEDYRWLPDLTLPMARAIVDHLGVQRGDTICDFGCARGYTVKALHQMGHVVWGLDISKWAVEHADNEVWEYVHQGTTISQETDWIIAKDVLEHVVALSDTITDLMNNARKGVFVVVPLSVSSANTRPARPAGSVRPDNLKMVSTCARYFFRSSAICGVFER